MHEEFGRYRLHELLGRGGMGEVYRARDTEQNRDVALKILPAHLAGNRDFERRFRRESELAAQLMEPHVIPIHAYGEIDGRLFIDMRLVRGVDLAKLIGREGRLAPQRAVDIVSQIASALDAAHRAGMVHRDVKPSNVLVARSERADDAEFAYLIDFGITRALESSGGTSLTATGALIGTLAYMAPECFLGDPVDARADVYALACTLYQCITGRPPFEGDGPAQLMYAHLNRLPVAPSVSVPDAPDALDTVIGRGFAKEPRERFTSCGDLAAAARAALRDRRPPGLLPSRTTGPVEAQISAPPTSAGRPSSAVSTHRSSATTLSSAASSTVLRGAADRHGDAPKFPARKRSRPFWWLVASSASVVALIVTLAVVINRPSGGSDSATPSAASTNGTLVLGTLANPGSLDPVLASDGESLRPARHIFETLVTTEPGGAGIAPGLATEWTSNSDGTEWTFTLRDGVTFHDGTAFDADAVCFNFDRWANFDSEAAQSLAVYYADAFGGFANGLVGGESIYDSCRALNPTTAVIRITRARGAFLATLALPSLSISSPTALQEYSADRIQQSGDEFVYSEYAIAHPTGTGPFKFEGVDPASGTISLVRDDAYWGEPALFERLVLKAVPDPNDRRRELQAGTIDGYELPTPADWEAIAAEGAQVLVRPPFNVLYLGINQSNEPALQDVRVRQAIAHAIDRESLLRNQMPDGTVTATQFTPATVSGHATDLQPIPYDPERARQLLADAGQAGLVLDFYYPTEVTRPYMPDAAGIFTELAEDLRQVGITVNPVAEPWNGGYLDSVLINGSHDLHLLGWTGDYNDAGNFIGTFFGQSKPEFGFNDSGLFDTLARAEGTVDQVLRNAAYEQANRDVMTYLPAVPLAHAPTALVMRAGVSGVVPSPVYAERFTGVSVS